MPEKLKGVTLNVTLRECSSVPSLVDITILKSARGLWCDCNQTVVRNFHPNFPTHSVLRLSQ